VRTTSQTGVEMEALTAVAVAALTVYDMVKAVDKTMVIGDIRLMSKPVGDRELIQGRKAGRREGSKARTKGRKAKVEGRKGRRRPALRRSVFRPCLPAFRPYLPAFPPCCLSALS